jgi:hypothetical protein
MKSFVEIDCRQGAEAIQVPTSGGGYFVAPPISVILVIR